MVEKLDFKNGTMVHIYNNGYVGVISKYTNPSTQVNVDKETKRIIIIENETTIAILIYDKLELDTGEVIDNE